MLDDGVIQRSFSGKDSGMRIASLRLWSVVVVGLLLGGQPARADFMNWSYQWSIGPRPVFASGTGTVAMALGQSGRGAAHLQVAAVTTSSSAPASSPDRFNSSFNLTLHLTDRASHTSGNLAFQGRIFGTLTSAGAHLSEMFPTSLEHLRLGGHVYLVSLPNRLMLLPPGASRVPSLTATVRVVNVWNPPPRPHPQPLSASPPMMATIASISPAGAPAPEPPALLLSGVGIVLVSLGCLWRYRSTLTLLRSC
jgi:hypothetical protein